MGFFKKDEKPESHFTTPRLPISPMIDVMTGDWLKCEKGDYTLNGGLCPHIAFTGKGNSNKTLLMISCIMTFLIRNMHCVKIDLDAQIYETENTLEYMRCIQIAKGIAYLMGYSDEEIEEIVTWMSEHFVLRNSAKVGGTEFYNETNEICDERIKKNKDKITLPFRDFRGKPIEIFVPHILGIDSFSAFEFDIVADKYINANTAGSSDNNMMYVRDAGAKTQMLQKWLNQNPRASIYACSSAHMGDNVMLEQRATPEKKMMFMKQNHKLKNVPEKYYFYVSLMLFVNGSQSAVTQDGKKEPLYPMDVGDKEKMDNKDFILDVIILRNKHGQSGAFLPIFVNQNMGVDWSLSEFNYIKDNGRWGISGDLHNYVLDLAPEIKVSRSTIRRKLLASKELRRAAYITCEMQLMFRYQFDKIPRHLRCTPKELYDGLKEMGYDWDLILKETRGYYTLDHYENPVKPLSTYDLLRMRVGEYVPYWMTEDQIPEKVKAMRESKSA